MEILFILGLNETQENLFGHPFVTVQNKLLWNRRNDGNSQNGVNLLLLLIWPPTHQICIAQHLSPPAAQHPVNRVEYHPRTVHLFYHRDSSTATASTAPFLHCWRRQPNSSSRFCPSALFCRQLAGLFTGHKRKKRWSPAPRVPYCLSWRRETRGEEGEEASSIDWHYKP